MKENAPPGRVLLVLPDAALGGGHAMNFRLATELGARGWQVDVAFLFDRYDPTFYRNAYPNIHQILLGGRSFFDRLCLPLRLARLAADYDLVVAGLDLAATNYSYVASRLARTPLVAWMHIAIKEQLRTVSRLDRWISLSIYRRLECIAFPSKGARSSLEDALDGKPVRAEWPVLENFNPRSPATPEKEEAPPELVFSKPVIINIGRLAAQKALDRLISAHSHLLGLGIDHHLLFVGEGPERKSLEAAAEAAGVSRTVFFPGHIDAPQSWLRRATVFALCSRYEGMPLVLLEALEEGIPIVSMDCPAGPREILADGYAGILTAEGDQSAFCVALEKLLRSPKVREIYAQRGKERAKIYHADRILPLWESLFAKMVAEASGDRSHARRSK